MEILNFTLTGNQKISEFVKDPVQVKKEQIERSLTG